MNEDYYYISRPPTIDYYREKPSALKTLRNARQARLHNAKAETEYLNSIHPLSPVQQKLSLENDRFRRRLMIQRGKEDANRRMLIERNTCNVLGSTASTAGKEFIRSFF